MSRGGKRKIKLMKCRGVLLLYLLIGWIRPKVIISVASPFIGKYPLRHDDGSGLEMLNFEPKKKPSAIAWTHRWFIY